MPRKVDPRWGEDGYHDWFPITLTDAQAAALAGVLDIDLASSKVKLLRYDVAYIGDAYWRWKGRGASAFSRAEARKALEDLLKAEHVDYAALTALNERAFQSVFDSLCMMKPALISPDDSVHSALSEGRLDEEVLRKAMRTAIDWLKAQKGPGKKGELAWAVDKLCRIYEDLTGRKATHSTKGEHTGYVQEPRSRAGRFVQACFALIDSHVTDAELSRAMRQFIESRG